MPETIKNIIFDLGGVVLNIDYDLTTDAFRALGIDDASVIFSKKSQLSLIDDLEKGNISEPVFFDEFRKHFGPALTDLQIRKAWNALILDLPQQNVNLIRQIRKNYRTFLLSNTNSIHETEYRKIITDKYGSFVMDELFETLYLSHHLHMRKPDAEIFEYVLRDAGIKPGETLFIDDSPQHIKAAASLGMHTHFLQNSLTDYWKVFEENGSLQSNNTH